MRWRGSVGIWIMRMLSAVLTWLQYSDLLTVVQMQCGSGWGRRRRNAKANDVWGNTQHFLPFSLKEADHQGVLCGDVPCRQLL